jgi:hypothetical protein
VFKQAREEVQEQLELSKQLTKKLKSQLNESDEEEVEKKGNIEPVNQSLNIKLQTSESKNPWISFIPDFNNDNEEEKKANNEEIYVKPKAFVDKEDRRVKSSVIENDSDSDDEDDDIIINSKPEEVDTDEEEETEAPIEEIVETIVNKEIDIKKVLIAEEEENDIEEGESHRLTLSEAFADDDVVAEFRQEKVCFN